MPNLVDQYTERFGPIPITVLGMSVQVQERFEKALQEALQAGRPLTEKQWLDLDSEALRTASDETAL